MDRFGDMVDTLLIVYERGYIRLQTLMDEVLRVGVTLGYSEADLRAWLLHLIEHRAMINSLRRR
jgi:hypothetical protein